MKLNFFKSQTFSHNNLTRRAFSSSYNNNILLTSKTLLESTKEDLNTSSVILKDLSKIDKESLYSQLNDDIKKKTFWINIYNTLIKTALRDTKMRSLYPNWEFFKTPILNIADLNLSFDDIEHKILRKSKFILSLGYITNPFPKKWETQLRVNQLDYRIHFALNCGAKSCPLIQSYDEDELNTQLEKSTKSFLFNDSYFDGNRNTLEISKIFYWFYADFGGKPGILNLHKKYGIIPHDKNDIKIVYKQYNWDIESNNYK